MILSSFRSFGYIIRHGKLSSQSSYLKSFVLNEKTTTAVTDLTPEQETLLNKFKHDQQLLKRLTPAEEVRTLLDQSTGYGVLSTNCAQFQGFPAGSIVGFAMDDSGLPIFSFSQLSAHTRDIMKDPRVALTVTSNDFKTAADGRVVLIGTISKIVSTDETTLLRQKYLSKHKDAFYIDFGDFSFYKLSSLEGIRYVGGFARATNIAVNDYLTAKPDPIAPFAKPVLSHMNDDHKDSTIAIVKHLTGLSAKDATITGLDKYGMDVQADVELLGGPTKVRVPFPKEVTDRKAIKEVLVQMTKDSSPSQ